MAIYNKSGVQIYSAYKKDGTPVRQAYDRHGNLVFNGEDGEHLKVMQYNVGGWYNGTGQSVPSAYDAPYYALQNGILQRHDPDILCIEEYRTQFTTGGRTAQSMLSQYFQYIEERQGTTAYYGHAVCSKYPILSYTENHYANDTARYYGLAVIDMDGTTLNVIVTHLSTDGEKRPAQSLELLNYANTLTNVIVAGDFNLHCHSKTDVFPVNGMVEWESYAPWVNAGYHLANNDDTFGFIDTMYNSTYEWWYGLDNIIVSRNILIDSVYTDRTKVTDPITSDPNWLIDHIPIIAEITI